MWKKSPIKRRKEIFKYLWEKEYNEDHLKKIDALARDLGIFIPRTYLVDFTPKDQEKIIHLLLEAEKNIFLRRTWIFSLIALIISIVSVCAVWWGAIR